jgi:hypothetical protein
MAILIVTAVLPQIYFRGSRSQIIDLYSASLGTFLETQAQLESLAPLHDYIPNPIRRRQKHTIDGLSFMLHAELRAKSIRTATFNGVNFKSKKGSE